MEVKSNNPKLTQKQISNRLGFSDSTIKRYRDDINMDSPYNRNNYKKRTPKQKPSTTTIENSKPITNKRSKTLKGGDPSNIHMSGKELIEQAFS